jgi:hypothetical protein
MGSVSYHDNPILVYIIVVLYLSLYAKDTYSNDIPGEVPFGNPLQWRNKYPEIFADFYQQVETTSSEPAP